MNTTMTMTNAEAKNIINANVIGNDVKASLRMKMFDIVFKNTIERSRETMTMEKAELMKRVFACFIMATKIKVESATDITTYKFNNEKPGRRKLRTSSTS